MMLCLVNTSRNTSSVNNQKSDYYLDLVSINSLMCFIIYGELMTENHRYKNEYMTS